MNNGANGVEALQAAFSDRPDLVFRHFEDCDVPYMRWQAGREICDYAQLPDGSGMLVEYFELICWAASEEGLIEKLSC